MEVEALSTDAGLYALAVRENSLSDRTTIPGLRFEVTMCARSDVQIKLVGIIP